MGGSDTASAAGEIALLRTRERAGPLGELITMRLIGLFGVLRRSGVLAQRRELGLSEVEWRIMTQVGQYAPLSLNGLAKLTLQDRGQLSRAVKAMTERGLLSRDRKPGGPEIEIDLTSDGRAVYGRMVERAIQRDRILTAGMSAADADCLRRLTDVLIERAEDMLAVELELQRWSPQPGDEEAGDA